MALARVLIPATPGPVSDITEKGRGGEAGGKQEEQMRNFPKLPSGLPPCRVENPREGPQLRGSAGGGEAESWVQPHLSSVTSRHTLPRYNSL